MIIAIPPVIAPMIKIGLHPKLIRMLLFVKTLLVIIDQIVITCHGEIGIPQSSMVYPFSISPILMMMPPWLAQLSVTHPPRPLQMRPSLSS